MPTGAPVLGPRDERSHPAGPERWWGEAWGFEFAIADASLGGFVRIARYPRLGVAWFWAAVVGEGRTYVLCREHELDLPPADGPLEVRGLGIWSHAICETPLEHWTVAMEAFALAFDDPHEAWRHERGDRLGLAFDLEWESEPSAMVRTHADEGVTRYEVACTVHGQLQVGDEEWPSLTATGWRHHEGGLLDWSGPVVRGLRADGTGARPRTAWHAAPGTEPLEAGAPPAPDDWRMPRAPGDDGPGRHGVAIAPLLVDTPSGFSVPLLRSLDWVVSDGSVAPGWREQLLD